MDTEIKNARNIAEDSVKSGHSPSESDRAESRTSFESRKVIPAAVMARLPRYYRFLRSLAANDVMRVSSKSLAEMLDVTPSQLRQDLSLFGGFGQQGYGYNVRQLFASIGEILGIGDDFSAVLVGHGPLADAVAALPLFTRHGVRLAARLYTSDGFDEYCSSNSAPDIAVLVLDDPDSAAAVSARVGVRAILNFSAREVDVRLCPGVYVSNMDISDALMAVCCVLKHS